MGIKYYCTYYPQVLKRDVPRLDSLINFRIKQSIIEKLETNPLIFGFPLHGVLKPHWKLRVGDYRVVYTVIKNEVRIIAIGHRREVYQMLENRM